MLGLIQRVSEARVVVEGQCIGSIDSGLLIFVGVQPQDDASLAEQFVDRLLNYRVFSDAEGRMNLSLRDTGGGLLLVPQFTLAADTKKGRRPSFTSAASPAQGQAVFEAMVSIAAERFTPVESGCFGADMQVSLVNDGPVTFILD